MKTKIVLFSFIILIGAITSCGLIKEASKFTDGRVRIGMTKDEFIANYGKPLQYNFFNNEKGIFCEELVYKELVFYASEQRQINSIFYFEDGRLVSQEQMEDWDYREQKMREKELEQIYGGNN